MPHTSTPVTIHRRTSAADFTVIPNAVLRDRRLSARARGVLVYLLSLADGWQTTADRLAQEFLEGRDAIRTALRELEAVGYLRRDKYRDPATMTWRSSWEVTDDPATFDLGTPELSTGKEPRRVSSDGFPATGFQSSIRRTPRRTPRGGRASQPKAPAAVHRAPLEDDNGTNPNPATQPAAAPPSGPAGGIPEPWCGRHPGGTETPCRPCGRARIAHDAATARAAAQRAETLARLEQARRSAPECSHGLAGGDLPAGDGRPYCPLCRRGITDDDPAPAVPPTRPVPPADFRAAYQAARAGV
jgi:hypothetical protein